MTKEEENRARWNAFIGMTKEESQARLICCPMCDKKKCERTAIDCDVEIYLKNKAESEVQK